MADPAFPGVPGATVGLGPQRPAMPNAEVVRRIVAAARSVDPSYTVHVYSGAHARDEAGNVIRHGSTRHDSGNTVDFYVRDRNGHNLATKSPQHEKVFAALPKNGLNELGVGMAKGGLHAGFQSGRPDAWGYNVSGFGNGTSAALNAGYPGYARALQRSLGVKADGVIGPVTEKALAAVSTEPPQQARSRLLLSFAPRREDVARLPTPQDIEAARFSNPAEYRRLVAARTSAIESQFAQQRERGFTASDLPGLGPSGRRTLRDPVMLARPAREPVGEDRRPDMSRALRREMIDFGRANFRAAQDVGVETATPNRAPVSFRAAQDAGIGTGQRALRDPTIVAGVRREPVDDRRSTPAERLAASQRTLRDPLMKSTPRRANPAVGQAALDSMLADNRQMNIARNVAMIGPGGGVRSLGGAAEPDLGGRGSGTGNTAPVSFRAAQEVGLTPSARSAQDAGLEEGVALARELARRREVPVAAAPQPGTPAAMVAINPRAVPRAAPREAPVAFTPSDVIIGPRQPRNLSSRTAEALGLDRPVPSPPTIIAPSRDSLSSRDRERGNLSRRSRSATRKTRGGYRASSRRSSRSRRR